MVSRRLPADPNRTFFQGKLVDVSADNVGPFVVALTCPKRASRRSLTAALMSGRRYTVRYAGWLGKQRFGIVISLFACVLGVTQP